MRAVREQLWAARDPEGYAEVLHRRQEERRMTSKPPFPWLRPSIWLLPGWVVLPALGCVGHVPPGRDHCAPHHGGGHLRQGVGRYRPGWQCDRCHLRHPHQRSEADRCDWALNVTLDAGRRGYHRPLVGALRTLGWST